MKQVELFLESKQVELFGNESFPLTFQIDDVSNIVNKSAGFSKEISIPGTKNNNEIFTSLFDINVEGGFNPISRKRAILYVDSLPLMIGYYQLNTILRKETGEIFYVGQIFEEQVNFMNSMDDYLLENLTIPITGTTTDVTSPPYTYETDFAITGITPGNYMLLNGSSYKQALDFSGLSFTSGSWGSLTNQDRYTADLPAYATWSPSYMQAYTASVDQYISFSVYLDLIGINNYEVYSWKLIKSDYLNPISGAYTDYILANGKLQAGANTHAYLTKTITTILGAGDKLRLEIWNSQWSGFSVGTGSTINGSIFTGSSPVTTTGYTISVDTLLKNINTVESSDDDKICFPLIDYSNKYQYDLESIAKNYLPNNNINNIDVDINNLRPWTFVKHVWDAIFKQTGFKYKSTFLNSTDFKRLIIGGGISEEELSTTLISTYLNQNLTTGSTIDNVNLIGTQDVQHKDVSGFVDAYQYKELHMSNVLLSADPGSNLWELDVYNDAYATYIPSDYFLTAYKSQVYYYTGQLWKYYGYDMITPGEVDVPYGIFCTSPEKGKFNVSAKVSLKSYAAKLSSVDKDVATTFKMQIQKIAAGSYKYNTTTRVPSYDNWIIVKEATVTRAQNTSIQNLTLSLNENIEMDKGDMIRVIIMGDVNKQFNPSVAYTQRTDIYKDKSLTYFKFRKMGTVLGSIVPDLASLLPKNFKQKDFVSNIIKMFNLFIETDKEDEKTLIIEPRDAYYELGSIHNWTSKIDYSKDTIVGITPHDFAKTSIFKYKDDSNDYLSTKYADRSNNKMIFGSYKFTSQDEYNTDINTLELAFAPSYLQRLPESDIFITKILNPKLFEIDYTVGSNVEWKIEPRIMFYKRVAVPSGNYTISLGNTVTTANYTPLSSFTWKTQTLHGYVLSYIPYAGHLNDPVTPTFDLNWYSDFNYLPNSFVGTNNSLINVFYKNYLIEMTDQTSRTLTAYVKLKPIDIINFRFCDLVYFEKEYWRVNQIIDFDTSSDIEQTTKCVFQKVVRANTNALIDYNSFGYLGISGGTAGGLLGGTNEG